MRNLRLLFTALLGCLLVACGGDESEGDLLGAVEQAACNCLEVIEPVCGEDGKTWSNECKAACAGVKVLYEGPCKDSVHPSPTPPSAGLNGADEACYCPQVWDPVCGVDGKTYGNECEADCEGTKVDHEGPCDVSVTPPGMGTLGLADPIGKGDGCYCPHVWEPVCGVDGKTYGNGCEAGCAGVKVAYPGECVDKCYCPQVWDPVCGDDGNTYGNSCEAGCAGVKVVYPGECRDTISPPEPPIHLPLD